MMINYRIAEQADLPQILELYKQLIIDETPISADKANAIWHEAMDMGVRYFVATDDKVISTCYLAVIPNLTRQGQSIGFIENVITDKHYRHKGIGRNVIEMAVQYAKENNCYKVLLQSNYSREESHIFYKKCDFDGDSKRAFEKRF